MNGKFDHLEFIFVKSGMTGELILYDRNEDGNVDVIRKRKYNSQCALILEKLDYNGDKKWDSVWTPDTGWVNLN